MNIVELLILSRLAQINLWDSYAANNSQSANNTQGLFAEIFKALLQELNPPQSPPAQLPALTSPGPNKFDPLIEASAQKYGVDPNLIKQVIKAESGFNPDAVSSAGAQGLMQLMPGTADSYGADNPFDPAQNIDAGTHFLKDLLTEFNGNVPLALAGYNAGPGAVEKYHGIPPYNETQNYVKRIMANLPQIDQRV